MSWTEDEIRNVISEIQQRAAKDPEFRSLALANPKEAVGRITAKPIPENFTLRCVENAGANITVVLPDPVVRGEELSDEELETVAGGGSIGKLSYPTTPRTNLSGDFLQTNISPTLK